MTLKNKNGAILILTLTFFLVFTMLGIASIHYATMENEFTERLKFSTQAFWLAEAAIERASSHLPATYDPIDPINSGHWPACASPWPYLFRAGRWSTRVERPP